MDYTYRYQCSVLLLILFVAAVTDVCGLQQCGCMQIAYHVCGTHMAHIYYAGMLSLPRHYGCNIDASG